MVDAKSISSLCVKIDNLLSMQKQIQEKVEKTHEAVVQLLVKQEFNEKRFAKLEELTEYNKTKILLASGGTAVLALLALTKAIGLW